MVRRAARRVGSGAPKIADVQSVDAAGWSEQSSRDFQMMLSHSKEIRCYLLQTLGGHAAITALSKNGNHAMRAAFEICSAESTTELALELQRDDSSLFTISTDCFGCRVINAMVQHHPTQNLGSLKKLALKFFHELSSDHFGHHVLCGLLEHSTDSEFLSAVHDRVDVWLGELANMRTNASSPVWDVIAAALTFGPLQWRLELGTCILTAPLHSWFSHVLLRNSSMRLACWRLRKAQNLYVHVELLDS